MEIKKTLIFTLALMFLISNSILVSAVTGSIGNAKMVLYPEVNGWTNTYIQKTIQINNVNEVPVNITLKLDENASKFIDLIDESFILNPGEDKKAEIEIKVRKEGRYEGRVNVFFKPVEGKEAGVVLSSTIIVIAKKDTGYDETDDSETDTAEEDMGDINAENQEGTTGPSKLIKYWGLSTFVLLVVLLILLYIWGKKRNQSKRRKRSK